MASLCGGVGINRNSFIAELRSLLSFMDPSDRAEIIKRYETMFEEAGTDAEEELLKKLGSPVRQVLLVEKEQRSGITAQMAEPEAEPVTAEVPETIVSSDDMLPVEEELQASDAVEVLPEEEETEEEPQLAENAAELPEENAADEIPAEPGAVECGTDEMPDEAAPSEDDEQITEPEVPAEPAEAAEELPEGAYGEENTPDKKVPSGKNGPGAGRIFGAIIATVPLIILFLVVIVLSVAFGAAFLASGVGFGIVSGYLSGYVTGGMMVFVPDMLVVGGGVLIAGAAALLFLWTGIWFVFGGIGLSFRMLIGSYRRILKGGKNRV